jgi:hypothetical protein
MSMATSLFGLFIGLGITVVAGEGVRWLLNHLESQFGEVVRPTSQEIDGEIWSDIVRPRHGGEWVGRVERLVLFVSFISGAIAIAVSWLALKLASNWQGANTMNAIPSGIRDSMQLDIWRARMHWASRSYVRFIVGTGANITIAFAGVGVARLLS